MEASFKIALKTQCEQERMEREVLDAWINDLSVMNLCDYCERDSASMETCAETFKWNGKPLERLEIEN